VDSVAQWIPRFFAVQNRDGAGQPQQILWIQRFEDIDWMALQDIPAGFGPIQGLAGGRSYDEAYGTERDPSGDYYLLRFDVIYASPPERVGGQPIGFPNVEGLAYKYPPGPLYATSYDTTSRTTQLIRIDVRTGVGTLIGSTSQDVWIVGLAHSLDGAGLYGTSRPVGTNTTPKLYWLDPSTGAETPIGDLGIGEVLDGLTWAEDGATGGLTLFGAHEHLYAIDAASGAATLLGADFTTGAPGDGVLGLAYVNEQIPVETWSWGSIKERYRDR
jgi:hypothetical protein